MIKIIKDISARVVSTASSVYWSSLDNLKLSYKVSDVASLNVTVTRKVWSHKGAVLYVVSA